MSTKMKAANEIRAFLRSFKGLAELAGDLEDLAVLEADLQTSKNAIAKSKQDEASAKSACALAQGQLTDLQIQVGAAKAKAEADSKAALKAVQDRCAAMTAEAEKKFAGMEAASVASLSAAADKLTIAEKSLKALEASLAEKQGKLAGIEKKLAEIKAQA